MDNDRSATGVMDERMLQKKELSLTLCRIVVEKAERTLSRSLGLGRDEGGSEHFRKKS